MLGLLAIAPLLGLIFLSFGRIQEANRASSELSQVQTTTADLVDLVELQASLQNEGFWRATVFAIDELGFDEAFTAIMLGVSPLEERQAAIQRTDELVTAVGLDGLEQSVAIERQVAVSLNSSRFPLENVIFNVVGPAVQNEVDEVISLAAEQRSGGTLVAFARKLEGANAARSRFADLRSAFFGNFADLTANEQRSAFLEIVNAQALYIASVDNLRGLVPVDGFIEQDLEDLETSDDRQAFLFAVDSVLGDTSIQGSGFDLFGSSQESLQPVALNFQTAEATNRQHLDLVESAATGLTNEVEREKLAAQRTVMFVLGATLAVAALTIMAIVLATRWIVHPLSDLGRTALALTLGGDTSLRASSGPREVQLIHDVLGEAITNLERTEQQAIALAAGDLDDPSLSQVVPGRFGATLHAAIEQLRGSISHQEKSSHELAYEAGHDGLTGLANRRAAMDFLSQALSEAEPDFEGNRPPPNTTVFFIDLDHFKEVNDTHGHAAGDGVLCQVAEALRSCARSDDMVGRIGGDEFLIVSHGPDRMEKAQAVGTRYLTAIKASLEGTGAAIGASIGVAMGKRGADIDTLLAEADIAMLEAKQEGRDNVRFFDAELRTRTLDEMSLSTNIRVGLELGEFQLHYQPIVDAVSGNVLDYEALIRWDRPGVGRVSPDDYIPFAERSDLVIAIDRWVLATAAETIASNALDGVGVAVNISGRHLANGDLFADLTDVLDRTGINPRDLTIEITESALLGDVEKAIDTLRRIRNTGVKVAIDDFGTGFTSLTHLRRLPADVLKIDQSFTSNLDNSDDANLVRLVIQTAHILRLDVVVEGVETLQQAQRVTMLGADQMQGYHFARPMALAEIVAANEPAPTDVTKRQTSSRH